MKIKKTFDFWIFLPVLVLLSIGIIMVLSASMPTAYNQTEDVYSIFKRQIVYAVLGLIVMLIAANFDYRKLARLSPFLLVASIVLLALVLVPGIGQEAHDARRWIDLKLFPFQPSEIAKFAIILYFSYSLAKRKTPPDKFFSGFMPYILLMGIFAGLIVLEPHYSCTIIILAVASIVLFCGGAKILHFFVIGIPGVAALSIKIFFEEYALARVLSFLDPWKDMQGAGWQAVQSLYAIGSGGIFGRGLGRSLQKFLYIPEPHNDFIFSILAEELGYIGVFTVMLLFLVFLWRGIMVAVNAPDKFGSLLAVGITSLIGVQSLLNIAVVTSSVPPTGVSLPFFSSGGTSLILFMAEVGVLLNISRYASYKRI
jgi:cell division protein FtsW